MRKRLLTGLIILLPVVLTLMVIIFLFNLFTTPFVVIVDPLVELIQKKAHVTLPVDITLFFSRFLSLIFLCIFILLLGIFTQLFIMKHLIEWGNQLMLHIPLVKTIYKLSRDVLSAIFSVEGKKAIKRPVMMPFPSKPNFCLGFVAGEVAQECQEKVKERLISVFAPTAPHPISGFLFLVPEKDVYPVDMTNEEVVKFLVSCGMIVPESEMKEPDDLL